MTAQRRQDDADKDRAELDEFQGDDTHGAEESQESLRCPTCGYRFITRFNGKQKVRTRILVFTSTGNTMGICPRCKTNLKLPIALDASVSGKD